MTVRELVARTAIAAPVRPPHAGPPVPAGRHGRSPGSVNVTELLRRERPAAAAPLEETAVLPGELFWLLRNADFGADFVDHRTGRPTPPPPAFPAVQGRPGQGRLTGKAAALAAATTCQFDAIGSTPEPAPPRAERTRAGGRALPRVTGAALALALAAGAWAASAAALGGHSTSAADGPNTGRAPAPVPAPTADRGVAQPAVPAAALASGTANQATPASQPIAHPAPGPRPASRPQPASANQRPAYPAPARFVPPRYQPPGGGRGPGGYPPGPAPQPQSYPTWQQQQGGGYGGSGYGGGYGGDGHHGDGHHGGGHHH